ncbi:MAG: TetR/AcrR family transcriptional regulator [Alphaproteobacteria bacterium]
MPIMRALSPAAKAPNREWSRIYLGSVNVFQESVPMSPESRSSTRPAPPGGRSAAAAGGSGRDTAMTPDGAGPEARGRREQNKATNRQAILDAAKRVFSEQGYGATTVRDIIRGTGLASGTFYNYFKSKEEVFEALMDQNALAVRPQLKEVRAGAPSFAVFLEGMFRTFFTFCASDQGRYDVLRSNAGHLRVRMDTREVLAGFDELQQDIEAAVASGLAPNIDADYLTAAIVGVAFELADRMLARDPVDVEGATRFATRLILDGVVAVAQIGPDKPDRETSG